jgi:hypothetical protein
MFTTWTADGNDERAGLEAARQSAELNRDWDGSLIISFTLQAKRSSDSLPENPLR